MEPVISALKLRLQDQVTFVVADVDTPEGARLAREYGVYGIPAYIFLDREGREMARDGGYRSEKELERQIRLAAGGK